MYDIRGDGLITLSVNSDAIGRLVGQDTVLSAVNETWVQRSVRIPITSLLTGANSFTLALSGDVDVDRLQLELAYDQ